MRELLWAHTLTNLRFFARSRLILGFALVATLYWYRKVSGGGISETLVLRGEDIGLYTNFWQRLRAR